MMHSTIATIATVQLEAAPLTAALGFLSRRIIERRNTIPILSHVALGIGDGGGLHLYGTDLDVAASITLDGVWSGGDPFAVTVDVATFAASLKKLDKGAHVELAYDGERLEIISGRTRSKLKTLPVDDMPNIAGPDGVGFPVPVGDLAALSPFMSKEEARYYLKGVAIQARAGELCTVATNGSELAIVRRPLPPVAEGIADAIVPDKAVAAVLGWSKKPQGNALITLGEDRGSIAFDGLSLAFKLIDGTFPDWEAVAESKCGGELQTVAVPELCPALSPASLAKFEKALGLVDVATGEGAARITAASFPEFTGITVFARDGGDSRYSYMIADDADAKAREYATMLAERAGLPAPVDGGHAKYEDGYAVGYQFGTSTFEPYEYEERPNFETLTMETVQTGGGETWAEGSYAIAFAPAERLVAADVSMTVDGIETPLRCHPGNGSLELSAKAIAALVGPVDEAERVTMPRLAFHQGRIIARDGIATDGTGRTLMALPTPHIVTGGKPGNMKRRAMTDREALDHYNRDQAGFMASLQPQWLEREDTPVMAETAPTVAIEAPAEPPVSSAERVEEAPTPALTPELPAEALSEPENRPSVDFEAMVEALSARVAALEAAAVTRKESEPETETVTIAAPAIPVARNNSARLRIIRRYLAMRKERAERVAEFQEGAEEQAASNGALASRLAKAEERNEALEFSNADMATRLAAAELRANEADAHWQPIVDKKQAQIVELMNWKLDRLSNGRVQLPAPIRLQAVPKPGAFKDIGGGCHALVLSPAKAA